jgi:hypothetical protein
MRRRFLRVLVFLCASAPRLAHADIGDWLDKLEKLSGPGPFHGRSFFVDYYCHELPSVKRPVLGDDVKSQLLTKIVGNETRKDDEGKRKDDTAVRNAISRYNQKLKAWQQREDQIQRGDPITGESPKHESTPFCTGDLRQAIVKLGVRVGVLSTDTLPLDYQYSEAQNKRSAEIRAFPVAATVTTPLPFSFIKTEANRQRFRRSLEAGAAVGFIRFSGSRFDSFPLWYAEIPRITYRPLATLACEHDKCPSEWTWWDMLEFELVAQWTESVDPKKFGAVVGPSGDHLHWGARFGISIKLNQIKLEQIHLSQ